MTANDHLQEIEYLRTKIVGLLAENPPRRSRAKELGMRLNRLIQLQLKREMKIHRRLHEQRA